MSAVRRAALYVRVSTVRQAEHDVSIPDQQKQCEGFAAAKGFEIVETYVEPGASATDDRRPVFQRMIDDAAQKPAPFDVIIVHSFSRFFRDQFQLEFYVRKLAKYGVKLVSLTQQLGDDPMSNMIRQIMALFDEYQSKENAKHTLRAMKENARQGFWNGSMAPIGYRIVDAEIRGGKTKKRLAIDEVHAETVRLMFDLAASGTPDQGPMGVKAVATYLNERKIGTRDGRKWSLGTVHQVLTRETYAGRHKFNIKDRKTGGNKPDDEHITMEVPRIVEDDVFDTVRAFLKSRSPQLVAPRAISSPNLLTGICYCAECGGAMTLRTGKGSKYRYYACSTRARKGATACSGNAIRMDALDQIVVDHLADRLLRPERLELILNSLLENRAGREDDSRKRIAECNAREAMAESKLLRVYKAIENGVLDIEDPSLASRIADLKLARDQAKSESERLGRTSTRSVPTITPDTLKSFSALSRSRIKAHRGGFQRQYVRKFARRIEVDAGSQVRIMGSKSALYKDMSTRKGEDSAANGVRTFMMDWLPE